MPAKPTVPAFATYEIIAIDLIAESALNPRKAFDESSLAELAASIKEKGVIQPIVVRPMADSYELVAGARRLRASKLAGVASIPAVIRVLDDKQVLEIMVIENAQRADVHPLEEADAFHSLIEKHGHTVETIAEKTGKPIPYVHQRLRFLALSPAALRRFSDGSILIGHALILCRLVDKAQDELLDKMFQPYNQRQGEDWVEITPVASRWTVHELRSQVRSTVLLQLSGAKFDTEDASLNKKAGPCSLCQTRTGAEAHLFGGELGDTDQCMNRKCYNQKLETHLGRIRRTQEKAGETVQWISTEWYSNQKDVLGTNKHEVAADGPIVGIYIDGKKQGEAVRIKLIGSAAAQPEDPAKVQYDHDREKWKETVGKGYRKLMKSALEAVCPKALGIDVARSVLATAVSEYSTDRAFGALGRNPKSDNGKDRLTEFQELIKSASEEDICKVLFLMPVYHDLHAQWNLGIWKLESAEKTANQFGIDHKDLLKQAKDAAGPQPEKPGAKPKKSKKSADKPAT